MNDWLVTYAVNGQTRTFLVRGIKGPVQARRLARREITNRALVTHLETRRTTITILPKGNNE